MLIFLVILFVYCQIGLTENAETSQKLSKFQDLFPDDYDKRTAPPQTNEGKVINE